MGKILIIIVVMYGSFMAGMIYEVNLRIDEVTKENRRLEIKQFSNEIMEKLK